ncbi:uncharacterized protein LOC130719338 [Lotus japonicus]|uniref:uncharacterized protein LOC130719338 n=1 Tax=Lotus japonicus TaxID=34305 RepID=UPI0025894301|nr:uncharacterized protein LOC130719338 [Lotus japonicus]
MENEYEVMHGVCEFQSVGIVINGNYIPTDATIEQPLLIDRWLDEHKVHNQYNSSTKLCLINALSPTKHGRVDSYETTKEIWDALTIAHEGTSNVKQTKINMLVTQYKMFKMREDESISDMFARFQGITNKMRQLGRTYDNADQVNKILSCQRSGDQMLLLSKKSKTSTR